MLDHHVSRAVFGHAIDHFDRNESMEEALVKLNEHYRPTDQPVHSTRLRVARLGCSFVDNGKHVKLVGVILAPCTTTNGEGSDEEMPAFWTRIGLFRWVESYLWHGPKQEHPYLPPPHDFQCIVR